MHLSKEETINKFHYEEILLILFICRTDLSNYDDGDLENFTECIEGRIEDLFDNAYLRGLYAFNKIEENTINHFETLREMLIDLYSSQWHNKMRDNNIWQPVNILAEKIIDEIQVVYIEPNAFMDDPNYLNLH